MIRSVEMCSVKMLSVVLLITCLSCFMLWSACHQARFFGTEVRVDLNSGDIRRIKYGFFFPFSEREETNAVAALAARIQPSLPRRWVLADHRCLLVREFDTIPSVKFVSAIEQVSDLLRVHDLDPARRDEIAKQFLEALRQRPPNEVWKLSLSLCTENLSDITTNVQAPQ